MAPMSYASARSAPRKMTARSLLVSLKVSHLFYRRM
jgi:hypothetical protein